MNNTFFETLFVHGDCTTFGGVYQTKVRKVSEVRNAPEFFCINSLDSYRNYMPDKDAKFPSRGDLNVKSYRNFMFEMDGIGLEDQLQILNECGIKWTSIVYSGSKSYHAIISLEKPLDAAVHTLDGIQYYKRTWRRIARKIDLKASEILGEDDVKTFVDYSCQNPSRLSRYPGFIRSGVEQALIHLGSKMSPQEFNLLIDSCPIEAFKPIEEISRKFEIDNLEEFWDHCPTFLKNRIRYVDWARPEGMYREIYKITVQAIDYTKAPKEVLLAALWERLFPKLISVGYPEHKLTIGVDHGYNKKIRSGEIDG